MSRAQENQAFALMVNREEAGDDGLLFAGGSALVDPLIRAFVAKPNPLWERVFDKPEDAEGHLVLRVFVHDHRRNAARSKLAPTGRICDPCRF